MIRIDSIQITKKEYCEEIERNLINTDMYYYRYEIFFKDVLVDYITLSSFNKIEDDIHVINHFRMNNSTIGQPFIRLISQAHQKKCVKFNYYTM